MKVKLNSISIAVSISFVGSATAFELETHTAMTAAAIAQSKITATPNTSAVFKKLGLYDRELALGSSYIDIGASIVTRAQMPYERDVMEAVRTQGILPIPTPLSIPGWIVRGAILIRP